jgi:hypothetical protein
MGLFALYYHVFSIAYKLYQRYFIAVRWMDAREGVPARCRRKRRLRVRLSAPRSYTRRRTNAW